MSKTPRTDNESLSGQGKPGRSYVSVNFARKLELELANWKRCAEMLYEGVNPPQGPSGEAIIDQLRDAEEFFRKLKEPK